MAIGSYAGAYTAPSNGLLISGNVGIGTPSASAANLTIAGTGTNILVNNNASQQILSFNGGTLALGGNIAGADGVLQLGGSSSFFVLTGIVSSGNATINNANTVGGVLDIQSQGTTAIRIAAGGGSIGIGGVTSPTVTCDVNGPIRTRGTTVAALPSASTAGAGARAFVTDSTQTLAAGIGGTVAGSGSNSVPVYSDGANWKIG